MLYMIFVFQLFLIWSLPHISQQECSSLEKCNSCSEKDCGSNNCYEKGFIGLFNGKCKYSKIHGGWGGWGGWSSCSASCGYASRTKTRSCNNPTPQYEGNGCPGSHTISDLCHWNPFCQDCDIAESLRTYLNAVTSSSACDSLQQCFEKETLSSRQRKCYQKKVHGGWTDWTTWSDCQILCKGAWRTRYRYCTNPVPLYTGDTCQGAGDDYQPCEYKAMKSGTPYSEKLINLHPEEMHEVLSNSISKIECILKCKIRSDCAKAGYIASKDRNDKGVCYKIPLDIGSDRTSEIGGQIAVFSVEQPAPPGDTENSGWGGFC